MTCGPKAPISAPRAASLGAAVGGDAATVVGRGCACDAAGSGTADPALGNGAAAGDAGKGDAGVGDASRGEDAPWDEADAGTAGAGDMRGMGSADTAGVAGDDAGAGAPPGGGCNCARVRLLSPSRPSAVGKSPTVEPGVASPPEELPVTMMSGAAVTTGAVVGASADAVSSVERAVLASVGEEPAVDCKGSEGGALGDSGRAVEDDSGARVVPAPAEEETDNGAAVDVLDDEAPGERAADAAAAVGASWGAEVSDAVVDDAGDTADPLAEDDSGTGVVPAPAEEEDRPDAAAAALDCRGSEDDSFGEGSPDASRGADVTGAAVEDGAGFVGDPAVEDDSGAGVPPAPAD